MLLDALDDVLVAIRRIPQRPHYRRRLLAGLEMPGGPATLRALRVVERTDDEGPSIGEVAEALALDPSTASRVVDRCVGAGLLERTVDSDDRRRFNLRLTEAGRDLLGAAAMNRRALLEEVTGAWDREELQRLLELLGELRVGFDRLESTP